MLYTCSHLLLVPHQSRSTIEKLNRSKPMNSNIKDDYEMKQQTSQNMM